MLEVHRELTVHGSEAALDDFVARLTANVGDGWQRYPEGERRMRAKPSPAERESWYAFTWGGAYGRPAASLWLRRTPGALKVTNIVPTRQPELTRREYNAILTDFAERCVSGAAEQAGVRFELSPDFLDARTLMDAATCDALYGFSRLANKETGLAHPSDEERWNAFVIAAHKADSPLRGHVLERWLVEEEGWPPTVAQELASQYEHDRALLRDFASAAA